MGKLLQINPVIRRNTSTGKIMQEIGELAMQNGWESYIAYSGGRDGKNPERCNSHIVPVGSRLSVALHVLETRLFDRHGLGSRIATRRFIKKIKEIDPDIIHIHNIHGYFLNYRILFDYLAKSGKPVIWTVHDCWLYTGHCYYYTAAGCNRWKKGCGNCPQKKAFPCSILFDRSASNFKDKSLSFNSIPKNRFHIIPVSDWIATELRQSFLKDCNIHVIHNGIDTDSFKPAGENKVKLIREKYGLGDKQIILGLASIWMKEKGLNDFIQMSKGLHDNEVIVLVGKMTQDQQKTLPKNIKTIARTENIDQLAQLYSAATVFVNPTWQDNYPTVNLEATSCGTPVITYRTGGSIESITTETGFVVEKGDTGDLLKKCREIEQSGKTSLSAACRDYALKHFRKEDCYKEYLELYRVITEK